MTDDKKKNENIDEENNQVKAKTDSKDKKSAKASKASKKADKKSDDTDFLKGCIEQELKKEKELEAEKETVKQENEHLNEVILKAKEKLESLEKEYENYRRRTTLEKESLGIDATCKAVKALLPALDNLERAMPFADSNPDSFKTGVGMTLKQMEEAFKSLGVEEIEAQGKEFDANLHDVVMHEDDPDKAENIVTDVFQKGYKLGDKVIRHSAVKVVN